MSEPAENVRSVVVEREFAHAPEKLWRALTESPLLAQWLMRNDFAPETGRRFQFRAEPAPQWDGVIDGEVLVVEPLKQLSYRWSSMGVDTVVVWTLTPTASGTHVRMEQTGFGRDQERAFQGATYGWQRYLDKLEQMLEGGAA